jgi:hypothetical protein
LLPLSIFDETQGDVDAEVLANKFDDFLAYISTKGEFVTCSEYLKTVNK